MRHNVWVSGDARHFTEDSVFYTRNDCNIYKGPGKVTGQDEQQVLVKYESIYIRVHGSG